MEEDEEELETLRAIYGDDLTIQHEGGEAALAGEQRGRRVLVFRLQGLAWRCRVKAIMPPGYPETTALQVSVVMEEGGCGQRRTDQCVVPCSSSSSGLFDGLTQHLESLVGGPAVHEALVWVTDRLNDATSSTQQLQEQEAAGGGGGGGPVMMEERDVGASCCWVAVVLIDHMRKPREYLRLLECWAQGLGLRGVVAVLASSRNVYVVLRGAGREGLAEWLRRLRTEKVDVDSKGRPCQERMASVLLLQPAPPSFPSLGDEGEGVDRHHHEQPPPPALVVEEGRWRAAADLLAHARDTWGLPV